ncbi:RNA polymerase sigma factor [Penaeicola halotolerans]|uniref:RNA polymerase sigma factor n=1 Tax=Penaeicola halotolerans TaxID=2793196 RepID=UPI001CF80A11|nr:sigma-70 family RNA polymerase sigma factor [Penaeicola halotolerans]
MKEQLLIQACIKGDRKAQNELYNEFADRFFRLCLRYLSSEELAEDVLVEGFLKIFKGLKDFQYENTQRFQAWMKKIMINECLMQLRKTKMITINLEDAPQIMVDDDILDHIAAEDIYQMITELPQGYRTVFNLYVIEGFKHQEIGEMLNISEGTSKSQLNKAKALLKSAITKQGIKYG